MSKRKNILPKGFKFFRASNGARLLHCVATGKYSFQTHNANTPAVVDDMRTGYGFELTRGDLTLAHQIVE